MAKDTPVAADEEKPPVKGRKKQMAGGAVMVALLLGGYSFSTRGEQVEAVEGEAQAPAAGPVVVLNPITLNLADGRFLKVGLALQLTEGIEVPVDTEIGGYSAPALDEAISVLGGRTYAELVTPGGRDTAKAELSTRIAARYEGDVMNVYFTELVMQ